MKESSQSIVSNGNNKRFFLLSHFFFLVVFILGMLYFKERSIGDTGWRLYCITNRGIFCPSHGRWILIFVQLFPLAALKLGLSLKFIAILYSIGPVIVYYILFLFCVYHLKNHLAGLAIILVFVLSLGEVYFAWPDLEMHLCEAFLICFVALLYHKEKWQIAKYILLFVLTFFILTSHPINVLPFFFLMIWSFIDKKQVDVILMLIAGVLFYFFFLKMDSYESGKIRNLSNLIQMPWSAIFADAFTRSAALFLNNLTLWGALVLAIYGLVKRASYLKLLLISLFAVCYILIILCFISYEQQEPYLLPFVPVVVWVFLTEFLQFLRGRQYKQALVLVSLVVVFELINIQRSHVLATAKVNQIEQLIEKAELNKGSKFLLKNSGVNSEFSESFSAFAFAESLILSSLKEKGSSKIIVPENDIRNAVKNRKNYLPTEQLKRYFPEDLSVASDSILCEYAEVLFKEEYITGDFKMWFYESLNPNYFSVDTSGFQVLHLKEVIEKNE